MICDGVCSTEIPAFINLLRKYLTLNWWSSRSWRPSSVRKMRIVCGGTDQYFACFFINDISLPLELR